MSVCVCGGLWRVALAPVNLIHSQSRAPSLPGASAPGLRPRLAQWLMRPCLYALYIVCRSELMCCYDIQEKMAEAAGCSPVSYLVSEDLFGWTNFCRKTSGKFVFQMFSDQARYRFIYLFYLIYFPVFIYIYVLIYLYLFSIYIVFYFHLIYFHLFVFLLCNNININTAIEATFSFYFYLQNYLNFLYRLKPTVSVLLGSYPN